MGLLNQSYHEDDPSYGYDARQSPEILRAIYESEMRYEAERPEREAREKAERERIAKVRRERVDALLEKGEKAKHYSVKVGQEVFDCPVLATEVGNADWALIGEQCFPVKFQSETSPFLLDEERRSEELQSVIEGRYGRKGYYFNKW